MACLSSRSHIEESLLSDRTHAVHQLTSQRSALPPAPAASQLLSILRDAATLLPSPATAASASSSPSTSAYAASVLRQCPTSRRVHSSFAAAGAHSALGEMLQYFAVSVTHLFTDGVDAAAVVSFPAEWERRLNAPDAAALRQNYLYELQGFSALFTYIWGNVAASHPSAAVAGVRDEDVAPGATPSASPAHQQTSLPQLVRSSQGNGKDVVVHGASQLESSAKAGASSRSTGRIRVHSKSVSVNAESSTRRHQSLPNTGTPAPLSGPPPMMSPSHTPAHTNQQPSAATLPSKGRSHFLPSLPLEGLVPSGHASEPEGNVKDKTLGETQKSARRTAPPRDAEVVVPRLTPGAKQAAIEQAMEDDRMRQLQRSLGVRVVRNYAKEEDMHNYLQSFQQNMDSVWDEDERDNDNDYDDL